MCRTLFSLKQWQFLTRVDPSGDDVHGQWKYYGGVLLHADFRHCLEVAKLDGCGLLFEDGGRFGELRRGLELPSAWMIFARRSRSASACRAMARCMVSGMSTC